MTRSRLIRWGRAAFGRRRWIALLGAGVAAMALVAWLALEAPGPAPGQRWGVDHLRIRRTAAGQLLDLRYRVVDPERAASLLDAHDAAYVVHERTGIKLPVPTTPKAGALRTTGQPSAGRSYFALFSNPGGMVKRGEKVSVVLGELTAELTVK